MSDYLDTGGQQISADSIRARLSAEQQTHIDEIITARVSELEPYDLEAVRELGKHAI